MQGERQPAVGDRWMLRQPEQLLHADVQGGCACCLVVDRVTIAGGRLEMRRRLLLQAPLQLPWQQRIERRAEIIGADLGHLRLAGEKRGKPFRDRVGECRIRQVRPFGLSGRA